MNDTTPGEVLEIHETYTAELIANDRPMLRSIVTWELLLAVLFRVTSDELASNLCLIAAGIVAGYVLALHFLDR